MKVGDNSVIIGKRVPVGAAINSVAVVFAAIFPEHSTAILGSAIAVTFAVQVIIANWLGVTK